MEPDRFQQNSKIFLVGLICLLLCLSLLAFGFYILPYLLWNWSYKVPGSVLVLREWLRENYAFSEMGASWLIFLIFFIPAIICGLISQWSSNYIEKKMYGLDRVSPEKHLEIHKDVQESISFGLKILLLILLVLAGVILLEWLIAPPSI